MTRKLLSRLGLLATLLGPAVVFQQGCIIDPDIPLQAFLTAFNLTLTFLLDNAVVGLR